MRIAVKNLSLEYSQTGSGPPLLLIHGYPLSRSLWQPQLAGLADAARVLAPDLRGHGGSDPAPDPYTMTMLADDCGAFLDELGVTDPIAVGGLSMGGYVAFEFFRRYPGRVSGLILAATRASADSPEGKAARDKAAATAREKGVGAVVETMIPKMFAPKTYDTRPELVSHVRHMMKGISLEGMLGDLAALRDRPDSTPTLSQIDKPTLILHGADDQIIPVSEARAMRAAISGARLEIIDNAGHLLNLEQPDTFNGAVRSFVASI